MVKIEMAIAYATLYLILDLVEFLTPVMRSPSFFDLGSETCFCATLIYDRTTNWSMVASALQAREPCSLILMIDA